MPGWKSELPELSIQPSRMRGGALRLVVSGELDMSTSSVLAAAISDALANGTKAVSVDLGEVSFLDSSGIRALIDGWRLALRHGVEYRVTNPAAWSSECWTSVVSCRCWMDRVSHPSLIDRLKRKSRPAFLCGRRDAAA
jgi:anti-sigma B factor antagonist